MCVCVCAGWGRACVRACVRVCVCVCTLLLFSHGIFLVFERFLAPCFIAGVVDVLFSVNCIECFLYSMM